LLWGLYGHTRTLRDEKLAVDPHFLEFLVDILEWRLMGCNMVDDEEEDVWIEQ